MSPDIPETMSTTSLCSCCETLSATPRRGYVPSHLQRVGPPNDRPRLFRYLCRTCGTPWAWTFDAGWGLIESLRRPPVVADALAVAVTTVAAAA
jgi:hypothetical protein